MMVDTLNNETLIYYGGAVKAVGDGKIEGYLIRFGGRDLEGEFFTEKTYLGTSDGDMRDTLFHHGMPISANIDGKIVSFDNLADEQLPPMKTRRDKIGIWAEVVVNMHDEYQAMVYDLANSGKLGWSSGAAGHTVRRTKDGEITRWIIAEGSLTPTPAEPRNIAMSIKTLLPSSNGENPEAQNPEVEKSAVSADDTNADNKKTQTKNERKNPMAAQPTVTQTEHEAVLAELKQFKDAQNKEEKDEVKADIQLLKTGAERLEADIKEWQKSFPRQSSGFAGGQGEEKDETKSLGDFALQMRLGGEGLKRLKDVYDVKATMTEADATSAGYMVNEQNLGRIDDEVNLQSAIPSLVNRRPVTSPTGYLLGRRVDVVPTAGSGETAQASGMSSKKRAETAAATETVFQTRRLTFNIQGSVISGIVKVSEELAMDAPFIEAEIIDEIGTVEAAMMEYFAILGNGTNEPQGISNWAGTLNQVAGTTGSFTLPDVKLMMSKMIPASLQRAFWIMHPSSLPDFLSLGEGVTDIFIQNDLAAAAPVNIYGRPVLMSQHMPQKGNDGAVLLADLNSWISFNLGGMRIKYSDQRYFETSEVAWKFDRRLDGKPSLPGAVTLADAQGSFQQSSFVKLLNT